MSHSNGEDYESDGERVDASFDFSKISDPESDDEGNFERESNEENGAETRYDDYQFMGDHDDEGEEEDEEADQVQEPSHKGSHHFFFFCSFIPKCQSRVNLFLPSFLPCFCVCFFACVSK